MAYKEFDVNVHEYRKIRYLIEMKKGKYSINGKLFDALEEAQDEALKMIKRYGVGVTVYRNFYLTGEGEISHEAPIEFIREERI